MSPLDQAAEYEACWLEKAWLGGQLVNQMKGSQLTFTSRIDNFRSDSPTVRTYHTQPHSLVVCVHLLLGLAKFNPILQFAQLRLSICLLLLPGPDCKLLSSPRVQL